MKLFFALFFIIFLSACDSGFGNKLASEKLDVYFDDKKMESYADSLGSFWTTNNLLGDRKQSIKLTKSNGVFEVRLIKSKEFLDIAMTDKESFLLEELRTKLQVEVFENKKTRIVICDDNFKELTQK